MYTAADDKEVTVLIGLHLSAAFDTVSDTAAADRVRRVWNCAFLDPVIYARSEAVHQAGSALVA